MWKVKLDLFALGYPKKQQNFERRCLRSVRKEPAKLWGDRAVLIRWTSSHPVKILTQFHTEKLTI